jgi:hypothetical protein
MERNVFLKSLALTAGFTIANPWGLVEEFLEPSKDITLPFPRGVKKVVTILRPKTGIFNKVDAQQITNFGYHQGYNYNNLAQYQQMYAYQQAVNQWDAYYRQQQQYYTWLQTEHFRQMQYLLQQNSNYQQIGVPNIWEHIRSMYAFAKTPGTQPTLLGLNSARSSIGIRDTLKGAANVWDEVNEYYDEKEAQKTTGPQSSEIRAAITIPNNITLRGKGYETKNGALAVSDELVKSEDGEVGKLVKFETGPDGEQYMVV